MEHQILFLALSKAILTSLGQGSIIYLIVRILSGIYPEMPSAQRYRMYYAALIMIFSGFIIALFRSYTDGLERGSLQIAESIISVQNNSGSMLLNNLRISASYSDWIAYIYLSGLLVQSVILLSSMYQIQNIRGDYTLQSDHIWRIRIEQFRDKMGIQKKVRFYLSEKMLIPFTAGFIKPMILFPVALLNRLSEEQVEAIILHEMAHIKRHDYLFNILQRIMEIVLFFNPIVWLLVKDIRREREFCCDDMVIDYSADAGVYSRALLQIAEIQQNTLTLSLSVSGKGKYTLLKRIKRITDMKNLNNKPQHRLFAFLGIAAVCISIAWIVPANDSTMRKKAIRTPANKVSVPEAPGILPSIPLTAALTPSEPLAPLAPVPPLPPRAYIQEIPVPPPAPPLPADTNKLKRKFDSPEWKKHMEEMKANAEEMKKKFDSPEWKTRMEEMKANAEEMKKKFDSPEWKKHMEEMKANAEEIKKKFDSPEWKKKMEEMRANAEEMKKKFDSPEWKKKIEEMNADAEELKKKFDSPEWKKQIEEMKKNSTETKKRQ